MSRIGMKPVPVASGVKVTVNGKEVVTEGKLGKMSITLPEAISAAVEGNEVVPLPFVRALRRRGRPEPPRHVLEVVPHPERRRTEDDRILRLVQKLAQTVCYGKRRRD